jgi:hypothetical protein
VFQARSRLTPRRRRCRYRRRSHGFHREPRHRRRIQESSALKLDGASATPTSVYHPSRDRRRSPTTRTSDSPRVRHVRRRPSSWHAFRALSRPRRRFGRRPVHVQPRNVRRHGRATARLAALTAHCRRRAQHRVTLASTRCPARTLLTERLPSSVSAPALRSRSMRGHTRRSATRFLTKRSSVSWLTRSKNCSQSRSTTQP